MDIKRVIFRNKNQLDAPSQVDLSNELSADATLEQKVIAAIRTVYDPEIHVNVYDLGLIYNININDNAVVSIDMTLTAPACPVAEILPGQVAAAAKMVEGVKDAKVSLVWQPPWSQACISEAARLELGLL